MRIVVHARVRSADREAVAERAPQPAVTIVAGFGEHGADRERSRGMQRRKGVAVFAPRAGIRRRVRPLALRELFERVACRAAQRSRLEQ